MAEDVWNRVTWLKIKYKEITRTYTMHNKTKNNQLLCSPFYINKEKWNNKSEFFNSGSYMLFQHNHTTKCVHKDT